MVGLIEYIVANPPLLAAICTAIGGILLKVVERFLAKGNDERENRRDFRSEIKELVERNDHLEAEIDKVREANFKLQEQIMVLKQALLSAGLKVDEPPK